MKNLHVHVWVCSTWDISGFFLSFIFLMLHVILDFLMPFNFRYFYFFFDVALFGL